MLGIIRQKSSQSWRNDQVDVSRYLGGCVFLRWNKRFWGQIISVLTLPSLFFSSFDTVVVVVSLSLSFSCLPIFRGLVMLIHGLAEHLGCYDELGCRLATENFLAFGHDHGKPIFFCFLVSSQLFFLLNTVSNDSDQTWLVVLEEVDYVTFSLEFIRSNQHQLQFWKNQYHQCCSGSFYFNCLFFNFL